MDYARHHIRKGLILLFEKGEFFNILLKEYDMHRFLALILLIIPIDVYADEIWQAILVDCHSETFEIRSYTENVPPQRNNKQIRILSEVGTFKAKCNVGHHKIVATISNKQPRTSRACGAAPGSEITVKVDDKILFKNEKMNIECYPSFRSILFNQSKWVGFSFKFCTNSGTGGTIHFNGCFEMEEKAFKEISLPLEYEFYTKPFRDNPWK